MKDSIIENLNRVHQRIETACKEAGRAVDEVQLLLATKTVSAEKIQLAVEAGETIIGENKVQELRDKDAVLSSLPIERHFIGHLQTNKIKDVLKYASCIQSLDRLKVVRELDRRLQREGRNLRVYVQVNTSYEDSKFGISPEKTLAFIRELKQFQTLKIEGLMTIGLLDVEKERMRPSLALLRETRDKILNAGLVGVNVLKLSMGMTQDLELAIEEGSNMVRVGTAVFGNRFLGKEIWNENKAE